MQTHKVIELHILDTPRSNLKVLEKPREFIFHRCLIVYIHAEKPFCEINC